MHEHESKEKFLLPGELYFGDFRLSASTFLGSCVAISLWHPQRHIGGLCHYVLPKRPGLKTNTLDGNYGEEAIAIFLDYIRQSGTQPHEYEVGMFGGGVIMPVEEQSIGQNIGARNIAIGRQLLKKHGFVLSHEDVGGHVSRQVSINLVNGEISLHDEAID